MAAPLRAGAPALGAAAAASTLQAAPQVAPQLACAPRCRGARRAARLPPRASERLPAAVARHAAPAAQRGAHVTCAAAVASAAAAAESDPLRDADAPRPALRLSSAPRFQVPGGAKDKRKGNVKGASSVSSGVRLESVAKSFKGSDVLKDVSWEVKKGERVGLVGWNGAGKTTQLKLITGEMEPDGGSIIRAKNNMKIAFLSQEFEVVMSRTVREEFLSAFDDALRVITRLEEVQKELESATDDMERMGALLDELGDLQKKAERGNVYSLTGKVDKMMPTLGFDPERDNDRLVASFSGGWQMRIGLGKILLQEPDLLLLDEPTNHLDVEAIEWLEQYLKSVDVPMVIVSHDREFLDQLCTKIVEVERGYATTYMGSYSDYARQKATAIAVAMAAWEKQQKEIERQTELILRLSGTGQAGRAEAAKKALEKIQSEEQLLEKPWVEKRRPFRFPEPPRSGRVVVRCEGLVHGYGNKRLINDATLLVERGERLALVGPNGCGKSTFLRLITGAETPLAGDASLGDHHVVSNYFAQNQAEALDLGRTVLGTLEAAAGDAMSAPDIKSLLGKMGFKGDAQHKKVEYLSGGEKARLALAKFMVTPASLLLLDEPTNHLDIPSKEMLEEALSSFEGTVLAVSHDRYFLRKIATRVLELRDGVMQDYSGDYEYFLSKNEDAAAKAEVAAEKAAEQAKNQIVAKSKMSKAEKEKAKKEKAKAFNNAASSAPKKAAKNSGRWN